MTAVTGVIDQQTQQLGATIRATRLSKGLTLVELARLSDLSHPFLSQLERGHARPSMASLERIARALERSQLDLLAGAAEAAMPAFVLGERSAGANLIRAEEGVRGPYAEGEGRLLVDSHAQFQPMEFTGANPILGDYYRHSEDEFLFVIEGHILVDLGDKGTFDLLAGDSIYYDGGTPHRWRSLDAEPYRLFVVKQRFGSNDENR